MLPPVLLDTEISHKQDYVMTTLEKNLHYLEKSEFSRQIDYFLIFAQSVDCEY